MKREHYFQKPVWIRNRLRYCIWHNWKKPEKKRRSLIRLGVDLDHAYAWSRIRMGGWAVAQSLILRTTITKERLRKRGYISMSEMFKKISKISDMYTLFPMFQRTAVYATLTYCGVRGVPVGYLAHWPSTRLCIVFTFIQNLIQLHYNS
jgi:hypothetical protein